MYYDNWVSDGPGAQKNLPIPINGHIVNREYLRLPHWPCGLEIIETNTGKNYYRADTYSPYSPYGWIPYLT